MTRVTLAFMAWLAALAAPAVAQQPSPAQIDAIKSNCRSDFMSKCRGVPTGGAEALQCLQKNHASLRGGCKTAVGAIMPAAKPPAAAAPAAPPPAAAAKPAPVPAPAPAAPAPAPAAAAPAAPKPAPVAAPAAPKAAAPKPVAPPKPAAASKPPAPKPAASPKTAAPKPAPASKPAVATAPASPAPAASTAEPPLSPAARKLTLKDVVRIRHFCFDDIGLHCKHIPAGQNRILDCLAAQAPALVPACRQVVTQAGQ